MCVAMDAMALSQPRGRCWRGMRLRPGLARAAVQRCGAGLVAAGEVAGEHDAPAAQRAGEGLCGSAGAAPLAPGPRRQRVSRR